MQTFDCDDLSCVQRRQAQPLELPQLLAAHRRPQAHSLQEARRLLQRQPLHQEEHPL